MRTTSISERRGRGETVAAHQCHVVVAQGLRQIAALRDVGDEQVGVAELVGDVPHRYCAPMKLPEWITGSQLVAAMPNGSVSSACACTTAMTSGRASKIAAWMKRSR